MSTNSIILAKQNYSLSDLNRYSEIESDFKSDVSTNSTKRAKRFFSIPQLDFSTLSTVLFSSLIIGVVYYSFIALQLLPDIITVLKFRAKKLFKENSLNLNLVFLPNLFSYSVVVQKKK